jgi:hypothetical protein
MCEAHVDRFEANAWYETGMFATSSLNWESRIVAYVSFLTSIFGYEGKSFRMRDRFYGEVHVKIGPVEMVRMREPEQPTVEK